MIRYLHQLPALNYTYLVSKWLYDIYIFCFIFRISSWNKKWNSKWKCVKARLDFWPPANIKRNCYRPPRACWRPMKEWPHILPNCTEKAENLRSKSYIISPIYYILFSLIWDSNLKWKKIEDFLISNIFFTSFWC